MHMTIYPPRKDGKVRVVSHVNNRQIVELLPNRYYQTVAQMLARFPSATRSGWTGPYTNA